MGCVWKGFNPFYPFQQMSPRPREAPPAACPSQGARPLTLLPGPRSGVLPSTGGPGQCLEGIQSLLSLQANESQAKGSPTSSVPKSRSPALNPSPATPRWRAPQHRWPWAIGCDWKGFKPFFKGFSGMRISRKKLHNQNPTCQTLTHLFFAFTM